MSDLQKHYRRILWIYPRGARRDELLDTLLEIAAPSPRETLNLIRCGLRARLGRPASRAVVVFAVLVALAGGFLGAAAANRLAWQTAPALPERAAVADAIFPGMQVWGGGDAALFVQPPDGEGINYGWADYWVKHTAQTRDVDAFTALTRDRLVAAGWTIRSGITSDDSPDAVTPSHEQGFWASKDGLLLSFADYHWGDRHYYDSDGAATFELYRMSPWWVRAATGLGGLLAALIGWLLTGWVSRRTEGRPMSTALAGTLTGVALAFLLPAVLISGNGLPIGHPSVSPFWTGLIYLGRGGAVWSGYFAIGVLAIAAIPRRRPRLPRWRPVLAGSTVAVLLATGTGFGWYRSAQPAAAGVRECKPLVPPALPAGVDVRLSRVARVFVSQTATADERNLLNAAIFRVTGTTGYNFYSEPLDQHFRAAYCGSVHLPLATARTLPWFFDVDLSSPGVYPALEAEVRHLPPVVGVQHVSAHE
jgi:hypothetical protein